MEQKLKDPIAKMRQVETDLGIKTMTLELEVLLLINKLGAPSSNDIIRASRFSPASVNNCLRHLEKIGIITIVADTADRRRKLHRLKPKYVNTISTVI